MSYDLSLYPSEGRTAPTIPALDAYFAQRAHYRVNGGSARYFCEATGTGFGFSYGEEQRGYDDVGPIGLTAVISGPATRALEIADEVGSLAAAFDLVVDDPTMHGMGKGPFDRAALVRGGQYAARFGFCVSIALSQLTDKTVLLYDDAKLETIWRWNRGHTQLSAHTDDSIFVPRITFVAVGQRVFSTVAWLADGPLLLPAVDLIATLSPNDDGATLRWVPYASIAPHLEAIPTHDVPTPHRFVEPTEAIRNALAKATALPNEPKRLDPGEAFGPTYWKMIKEQYEEWSGGKKLVFDDGTKKTPAAKKKTVATKKAVAEKRPATKKPATKKPATKTAAKKKAVAKKTPAAKKPVTKKLVTKKPVTKKPVTKKPVTKKPVTKSKR